MILPIVLRQVPFDMLVVRRQIKQINLPNPNNFQNNKSMNINAFRKECRAISPILQM